MLHKKAITLLIIILFQTYSLIAQVGFGTKNPHPSSILEVSSTNKGFLPPRLNIVQRNSIIDPTEALTVYCKNCCSSGALSVYNGTKWYNIPNCEDTDFDDDGVLNSQDIDDDNDGIPDIVEECVGSSTKSYFHTSSRKLAYYDVETQIETNICTTTSIFGDLGIDTLGVAYGITLTNPSRIIRVDLDNCTETEMGSLTFRGGNSLSFIPNGHALVGGASSAIVYELSSLSPINQSIWHDFSPYNVSKPGGDFIIINNKLYISFVMNSGETHLFEITFDSSYQYISHIDLGNMGASWGFSFVKGKLYSFYQGVIRRIIIASPPVGIPVYTNPSHTFNGGTALDESFGHCVSTDTDIDGDGIENKFDLDSDGDGCSDAFESGNTTNTSIDFQFTLEYVGVNGLNNSIENNDLFTAISDSLKSEIKPYNLSCP